MGAVLEKSFQIPLKRKRGKVWAYGSVAVVIVLGGAAFAIHRAATRTVAIPAFDRYPVSLGTVTQTVGASATVQAPSTISLSFASSGGTLTSLIAQVGQMVRAGQTLATVSDQTQRVQLASAEAGVTQAESNLTSAQAKLQKDMEGPTAPALALAKQAVTRAQLALNGAKQQYATQVALYNDRTSSEQQVISAQNAVTTQQAAVQNASVALTRAKLTEQEALHGSTPESITALQFNVTVAEKAITTANAQLALAQSNLNLLQQALQAAEQTLSTDVQNGASAAQISADQAAVRQAQQSYNNGQSALTQNQSAVTSDEASLLNAENALAQASPGATTNAALLAKNSVTSAQNAYNQALTQLAAAKANLRIAQALYNDRTSQAAAVQSAQNTVAQDQIALQSANASLQQTELPTDPTVLETDRAAIQSAQASLQSAQAQLLSARVTEQDTVLIAPVSGQVVTVNGAVGEQVSAGSPTVVIDQTSGQSAEINLQVPESEIGSLKAGETLFATATAYPSQTFTGQVTQVYPTPQVVSNVTEYTVLASVKNASGLLRPGMTMNVTINAQTARNVIAIPASSLTQIGTTEGVYVIGQRKTFSGIGSSTNLGGTTAGGSGASSFTGHKGRHRKGGGSGFGSSGSGGNASTGSSGASGTGAATTGSSGASGAGAGLTGIASFSGGGGKTPFGKQVYFQPVTVGLFGTSNVQIVSGLSVGQQILLVPPVTNGTYASSTSTTGGFGGGGGRFGGGGRKLLG
ncbi:HlyD family efflux transporter periplasmic adaptor subunit [Ferroacidibacillus organovorans]|uniref:CusB-like beta-barrel domain-containing protein n=1 Tax=Ferroacidibacillus organovorans TaxID=1765683 RepID=A0A1V4EUS7_9BACL|nr:HlyD family efflux transporter periplasmic adaptor subunit [Ferroacidibacillus organovorans]OPG16693.1 hypothetical protein B2M26_04845 [Ferroacidibacillus organovorans]